MRHPFYLLFGLLVVGALGAAELRGWSLLNRREVRNVPRSVRDNPGSYRPAYIYSGSGYRRGK